MMMLFQIGTPFLLAQYGGFFKTIVVLAQEKRKPNSESFLPRLVASSRIKNQASGIGH
jgi:hypothetical protein